MTATERRDAVLLEVAQRRGTPCFVYFVPEIRARVRELRAAFGGRFAIGYAIKANPHPELLRTMSSIVDRLDVSSGGELQRAIDCGYAPSRLTFTGPGKRDDELSAAVTHRVGEVVLESVSEARRLNGIAGSLGTTQDVLVRVAPAVVPRGFGDRLAGRPTAFGIDEDELPIAVPEILALPHLRVTGLHAYSGTQSLDWTAIAENWRIFAAVFGDLSRRHALRPSRLIFGAGLGIPHHDGQVPLDVSALAVDVAGVLEDLAVDPATHSAELVLESGRYLVGEAGVYLTRVLTIKRSRGARIAICDGGMHHHAAAAGLFGMVIRRPYRLRCPGRAASERERVSIAGPLCTTLDGFGEVDLPPLREGDVIAVAPSGAYGPTASPLRFIGHPPPAEHLIDD